MISLWRTPLTSIIYLDCRYYNECPKNDCVIRGPFSHDEYHWPPRKSMIPGQKACLWKFVYTRPIFVSMIFSHFKLLVVGFFLNYPQKSLFESHFVSFLHKIQEPNSLHCFFFVCCFSCLTFSLEMVTFPVSDEISRNNFLTHKEVRKTRRLWTGTLQAIHSTK